MSTQREEIAIRLGVDSRSAVTNLERFQTTVARMGKDIGKSFSKGVGKIADSLGLMNIITQVRELGKEFSRLSEARDFEAIQKQFGNLTGSEMEALENVGVGFEKFWQKVKVTTLGGAQSVMNVIAEMVHSRKGFSAAMDVVVDADIAKMKEFADALEAARAEKLWLAEKDALLRFKALQDQIEYKRADTEGKIKMLETKISEMNALMGQAATPAEQYDYAGKILVAEDQLGGLKKQQYLDQSMRDLQNAHDFMDAQPETRPETTDEYLERGRAKDYLERGKAKDWIERGAQSAAQRYAAAGLGNLGIYPYQTPAQSSSPSKPQPIEVIVVGVDTK